MLENESWLPCPLQPDFSIKTLREFDFSRNVALPASLAEANVDVVHGNLELFNSTLALGGFSFENEEMPTISKGKVLTSASSSAGKNGVTKSLSARSVNQATNDDDSSDDEGPEELKRDFVEDGDTPKKAGSAGGAAGSKGWEDESVNATVRARRNAAARGSEAVSVVGGGPILASTTVYVVRTIGHYMSMAQVLSPIAYEVLVAMTHVVEYYVRFLNIEFILIKKKFCCCCCCYSSTACSSFSPPMFDRPTSSWAALILPSPRGYGQRSSAFAIATTPPSPTLPRLPRPTSSSRSS